MSSSNVAAAAASSAPAANPAADRAAKVTPFDSVAAKVQKHVDGLNAKIEKLTSENAALKTQLHAAKASNSRIRRIPKKKGGADAE